MWVLFADELSGWGAAAIGSVATAVLAAVGTLVARWYMARGGYAKDVAAATVSVSDAERKARREQEDADRKNRREEEDAEHKRDNVTIRELKALVEAYKLSHRENRDEIHELRDGLATLSNKLAVCEVQCARRDERIGSLEDALTAAGIPHRPWNPGAAGGSGAHVSLRTPPPVRPPSPPSEGEAGE
jgi:hypothetical protein